MKERQADTIGATQEQEWPVHLSEEELGELRGHPRGDRTQKAAIKILPLAETIVGTNILRRVIRKMPMISQRRNFPKSELTN